MPKTTKTEATKTSKLDILHKAIYPGIGILLAVFFFWSNTDKQRQIDRLQAEVATVKDRQQTSEREAEEHAHHMRVEICKGLVEKPSNAGEPMESVARRKAQIAWLEAALKIDEAKRLGEDKAEELWEKAKKDAEKKVKKNLLI